MAAYDSFLMTNYRWIETYCHEMGEPSSNGKLENYRRVLQDFPCSFAIDTVGTSHNILEELKNKAWQMTSKGLWTRKNISLMEREEYTDFLSQPEGFIRHNVLSRLYETPLTNPLLREKAVVYYESILRENEIYEKLKAMGHEVRSHLIIGAPLDLLADFMRGTRELLMDLHGAPEMVAAACAVLMDLVVRQAATMKKYYGTNHLILPLHLPTLLSRKDYEHFFHPTYQILLENLLTEGYQVLVLVEGNADRFVDLLAQTDSPNLLMHFEGTNPTLCVRHFWGKSTKITGFYPTHLLQYGSLKECLEEVQILKETLNGMSNYIFSTNKVLLGQEDGAFSRIKKVYQSFAK